MKKVTFGKLKRKNYKGIRAFFRRIRKKENSCWVASIDGIDIPIVWDPKNKIDMIFDGREVGFEFVYPSRKKYVNIVTFYPDTFKKMYPERV